MAAPLTTVGLMSGTSADGVDAAIVTFNPSGPALLAAQFYPYPKSLSAEIQALYTPGDNELDRVGVLDRKLGAFYGECVNQLLAAHHLETQTIDAIGCHGQTLRHRPRLSSDHPFTLQVGCPHTLVEATGIDVVADFRRRDIAVGGQGAPLAPAFHQAMFHSPEETRVVANIGGVANITVLPKSGHTLGFDTGPGNGLMDAWIRHNRGVALDINGAWASSGRVSQPLLAQWLDHPYFLLPPPKSTGREEFSLPWLLASLTPPLLTPEDVQATLVELTAITLTQAMPAEAQSIYVCGGGAHNAYLMSRLQAQLPKAQWHTTEVLGVAPDWVEAMAFAWLAKQALLGEAANLPEVTGARKPVPLGTLYKAGN